MTTIKLIGFLFLSIITQAILVPFRLIVITLNILRKVLDKSLRILEGIAQHTIDLILFEVLGKSDKYGKKKE